MGFHPLSTARTHCVEAVSIAHQPTKGFNKRWAVVWFHGDTCPRLLQHIGNFSIEVNGREHRPTCGKY
jgi:hypothetical protein